MNNQSVINSGTCLANPPAIYILAGVTFN